MKRATSILLISIGFYLLTGFEPVCSQNQRTLFDSTSVFMEASGLSHVYGHKKIKMESMDGCTANSVIKVDYDPLSAYVEIRKVVVHRVSGRIDTIVGSNSKNAKVYDYTAPARLIYWGARQKMVEVGHLSVGDQLEYWTYRKGFTYALLTDDDAKYIPPMKGHFYDIVPFWSTEPIDLKVYQVSVLTSKNLRYAIYNGKVKAQSEKVGDRTIYTFSKTNIKPAKREQGMLANNDVESKVLLSTSPNWEAKSIWFYNVNEDYGSFKTTPELQKQVDILLLKAKNELDSISILTHWVADNMRYAGISMGPGEGYTLHNAEMNLTDRCGVCKDKAGLLVAMLRAAGFKSYAAMTMAGERIDRIPADQFNHSVCVVQRRNGNYQLLDPTWVPNVRELWSSAEQQQGYLMGLPNGADLMETPVSAPENHYIKINAITKLSKDGTLSGNLTINAEGQSDNAVRRVFGRESDWRNALETELLKICPQAVIKSIKHTRTERYLEKPVSITYEFEIPNYAIISSHEAIFIPLSVRNIFSYAMSHLRFDTSKEYKQYPFADACSRMVDITEQIELPFKYENIANDTIQSVNSTTGSYNLEWNVDNKTFTIRETIKLNKRKYQADEWPDFRQIVENQKQTSRTPIVLNN